MTAVPKPKGRKRPRRFAHRRNPEYAAWIRAQHCLLQGYAPHGEWSEHACFGSVEAAHVKSRGTGGDDVENLIPLCTKAHHEQHAIGMRSFRAKWGIDFAGSARAYYKRYLTEGSE